MMVSSFSLMQFVRILNKLTHVKCIVHFISETTVTYGLICILKFFRTVTIINLRLQLRAQIPKALFMESFRPFFIPDPSIVFFFKFNGFFKYR